MKKLIYRLLDAFLRPLGYGIWNRAYIAQKINRPTLGGALTQLRAAGLMPATIFDIGVATGTPPLQKVYGDVPQLLIEPLEEFHPAIHALAQENPNLTLVAAAAGATSGSMTFNVDDELDSSSLYTAATSVQTTARTVPVVTLDQLCTERQLSGPFLIKADVEGAELDVLAGAQTVLQDADCVVLEGTLLPFRPDAPLATDLIAYMIARDFVLHDIVDTAYRPLDDTLARVDLIFVPADSLLRSDMRYTTARDRAQRLAKFEAYKRDR